jgi:hypothetical protein
VNGENERIPGQGAAQSARLLLDFEVKSEWPQVLDRVFGEASKHIAIC